MQLSELPESERGGTHVRACVHTHICRGTKNVTVMITHLQVPNQPHLVISPLFNLCAFYSLGHCFLQHFHRFLTPFFGSAWRQESTLSLPLHTKQLRELNLQFWNAHQELMSLQSVPHTNYDNEKVKLSWA